MFFLQGTTKNVSVLNLLTILSNGNMTAISIFVSLWQIWEENRYLEMQFPPGRLQPTAHPSHLHSLSLSLFRTHPHTSVSHNHIQTLSNTPTPIHTLLFLSRWLTHTLIHTHSLTISSVHLFLSLYLLSFTLSVRLKHTNSHTHTNVPSISFSLPISHTHTNTHTHTRTLKRGEWRGK